MTFKRVEFNAEGAEVFAEWRRGFKQAGRGPFTRAQSEEAKASSAKLLICRDTII